MIEIFHITYALCTCWHVRPEPQEVTTPVYSTVLALLVAGELDPWCRPFYNQLIQRYLPNSQLLVQPKQGHTPGYTIGGVDYARQFLAHPYQKLAGELNPLLKE